MVDAGEDYEVDDNYDPEAEVVDWGQGKKLNLPEVPVVTGEEDDEVIAKYRSKLYRWANATSEWKERGAGDLKFLKSKKDSKIRIVLRQDKTHKVVANFYVSGTNLCQLTRMKTNDKSWVWTAYDCSDLPATISKLCARFVSKEDFEAFEKDFVKAYQDNVSVVKSAPTEVGKEKAEEKKEGATETAPEKKE